MQTITVLFIILAAILALIIVLLQYFFKTKRKGNLIRFLSFLRFSGVFGLLLLLINPKLTKTTYTLEKANLALLVDNSSSVRESGEDILNMVEIIKNSPELSNRFKIDTYSFGSELKALDTISFDEKKTDITKSLDLLKSTYLGRKTAVVLLSDGNQTIGQDYVSAGKKDGPSVYTMTVGDTTKYEDLSVGPINTNTYAFLNNKYPLETYVAYQGKGNISSVVTITVNGNSVFRESVTLSKTQNIQSINTLINADAIGVKTINVAVKPLTTERNKVNNSRETSVEIIDEKTNIALVSEILHPDLGALKKAIESNEQRVVNILEPDITTSSLDEVDVFLLYQPSTSFKNVIEFIEQKKSNVLIITGLNTDFNYLNVVQVDFEIESGYPEQEVFGNLNKGFSKFDITDFNLNNFPPLQSDAGPVQFNTSNEAMLNMEIKGLDLNTPLLTLWEDNSRKKGLLLGEGLWKWRIQSFRNSGDFSNFDELVGKIMRYLSTTKGKDRLNVDYSNSYEGSEAASISATYFDEAYIFDSNAVIEIAITNEETKKTQDMPMVLKNGYFEVDLTNLLPGEYTFEVVVKNENYSKTGSFVISNFDVEKQFVSSNYRKMSQLAVNTNATHYFSNELDSLLEELTSENAFLPTQKSTENVVSLIDFRILLAVIAFAFATEWFLRKYNGLI
ncbi:MAG: vWA domain-containing protein [Maribacter sp.]